MIQSLFNMGLRAAGLIGRFALVMYLARYFSLADVGLFGLISGIVGFTPALVSWGMNYFLHRQIVGLAPELAGPMIRDRLVVTFVSNLVASVLILLLIEALGFAVPPYWPLVIAIVTIESVTLDIYLSLISLSRPMTANTLLFVRTALWAFPVIGFSYLIPELRTMQFVVQCWLGFVVFGLFISIAVFRNWPLKQIVRTPIDWPRIGRDIRRGKLIYVNDVGIAGALYLDRFVVGYLLSLQDAGIFTIAWSVANAVHVVVTTGVIQVSLPQLVSQGRLADLTGWRAALRQVLLKVLKVGAPFCLLTGLVLPWLLTRLGQGSLGLDGALLPLMLIAGLIRLISDVLSYGLYSLEKDVPLAVINISGILFSLLATVVGITLFGLNGAGVGMIASAILILLARLSVLRQGLRHVPIHP